MKRTFKNTMLFLLTLMALVWSAVGVSPAYAATINLNDSASCIAIGGEYIAGDCRYYGNAVFSVANGNILEMYINVTTGYMTNNGTININNSSKLWTFWDATNNGTITVKSGSNLTNMQGAFTNNGDIIVECGGTVGGIITGNQPQYDQCHTVTFDGNGADAGSMSDQVSGSPDYLTKNGFTRTGYTFNRWTTEADGSGDWYADEEYYDFSADLDLYAQWKADLHHVTYAAGGGTGNLPGESDVATDDTFEVPNNKLTRDGYTFAGWNDGNATYQPGDTYTMGISDVTLTAQWTAAGTAPTVSTDSIETLQNRRVNATLGSLGSPASVTAHGVVYSTASNPTVLNATIVDRGATTTTGAYNVGLDGMNLTPGTKYYVRAFATNATGTAYGDELVVYGTPGSFSITAPANNATGVSTSPTLSWNASTGATDYQYCAAAQLTDCTSNMTGPNWISTGGATSVNLSGLLSGTTYQWAVRAVVGTPASYKWASNAPSAFTTAAASGGSLPTSPSFGDVPMNHPYWSDIEILYANGLTAGCSTTSLEFCPDMVLNRAHSAVFLVRSHYGNAFTPPSAPWPTFGDDFSPGPWAQPWVQAMYNAGLTAGCSTNPMLFCPWQEMTRAQAAVFGMRLKYGTSYLPPVGTGTVFADITDPTLWYAGWAERAYSEGMLPACGTQGGKPLFCPDDIVARGLGAHLIVRAKNLTMP